jgi:hypothetical protein
VSPSTDGGMLEKRGDGVLSGVFSRGELEHEFPRVRGMLHVVVMRDRGMCLRTAPVAAGPSGSDAWRP